MGMAVSRRDENKGEDEPLRGRMKNMRFFFYLGFLVVVAAACYLRPVTDDFDRHVYEAIIRSERQSVEQIYPIVKHESAKAEASSVLDSPEHLAQLEPLYAIHPLYIKVIDVLWHIGLTPQEAINFTSAFSLFLIGMFAYGVNGNAVYSAVLIMAPPIVMLGRNGGPDGLSSLVVAGGCIAVLKKRMFPGILLLMLSIWIRTDNVLICMAVLTWLCWKGKLKYSFGAGLGLIGVASVECINRFSGNYGWKVLLHYSFVGGKYPAEITSGMSLSQYAHTFLANGESLVPQLALWLLLAIVVWNLKSPARGLLVPIGIASAVHYFLFPSGEARYLAWACLLCGILFIDALNFRTTSQSSDEDADLMPQLDARELSHVSVTLSLFSRRKIRLPGTTSKNWPATQKLARLSRRGQGGRVSGGVQFHFS
jgi:hypothetical protein